MTKENTVAVFNLSVHKKPAETADFETEETLMTFMGRYLQEHTAHTAFLTAYTRVVPKVMSNFFFACELGTADEGECGGR